MKRLVFAALVAAAVTAHAGLAASAPTWTARGKVTALTARAITVHGTTCRITTTVSPSRATLRLYAVGTPARIACANGVLTRIIRVAVTSPSASVDPTPSAIDTLPVNHPGTTEPPTPGPPTISAA
jgi:hypothetical protein